MSRYSYRRVKALVDALTDADFDYHGVCRIDDCHRTWRCNRGSLDFGSAAYNEYAVSAFLLGLCGAHTQQLREQGGARFPKGLFDQHLEHGGGVWRGCKHGRRNHCRR